jgi:hypothetical protein
MNTATIVLGLLLLLTNVGWLVAFARSRTTLTEPERNYPEAGSTVTVADITPDVARAMDYPILYARYKTTVRVVVANSAARTILRDELNARHEKRDAALVEKLGEKAVAALSPEKRQALWNEIGGAA